MTTVAAPRRAPARSSEPTIEQTISMIEQLVRADRADLPKVPGWCARCDQWWWLPIGPGGELCTPCKVAEEADREIGRQTR